MSSEGSFCVLHPVSGTVEVRKDGLTRQLHEYLREMKRPGQKWWRFALLKIHAFGILAHLGGFRQCCARDNP